MDSTKALFNNGFSLDEQGLALIKHVTQRMPCGFYMTGEGDSPFTHLNPALLDILGCRTMDDFFAASGEGLKGFIHADDYDNFASMYKRCISEKKFDLPPIDFRIRRADGSTGWLTVYGYYRPSVNYGNLIYAFVEDKTDSYIRAQEDIRKTEIIKGLAREYNSIYLVDFETQTIYPYAMNNAVSRHMKYAFNASLGYKTTMTEFADRYVQPEDHAMFLYEAEESRIKERIAAESSYSIIFKRSNEGRTLEYVKMTISRTDDKNRFSRVIMSFKNITETVVRNYEKELLNKTSAILHALETDYFGLVDIDLSTGDEIRIPLSGSCRDVPGWSSANKYSEGCISYANTYVIPEEREEFLSKADLDNLKEILEYGKPYVIEYTIEVNGDRRRIINRYTISKDAEGTDHIYIGSKEKT